MAFRPIDNTMISLETQGACLILGVAGDCFSTTNGEVFHAGKGTLRSHGPQP
jgi:hypothetical protein